MSKASAKASPVWTPMKRPRAAPNMWRTCAIEAPLVARILHSTIAHGYVKAIDTAAAEAIPGVVKVLTCFDAPNYPFPTAGHPWSTDPAHQDVADRLLLNRHVRYYGDDIAAVIAEDEVAAAQAVRP